MNALCPSEEVYMKNSIDFFMAGDNVVQQFFAGIDGKAAGNKTIDMINLSRLRNVEASHVLYVSNSNLNISARLLKLANIIGN